MPNWNLSPISRYNDVLKFGLPDWRTPSFYYRKLRKMHMYEIFALFTILATLIHYACLWGAYFEKKLDMVSDSGVEILDEYRHRRSISTRSSVAGRCRTARRAKSVR